MTETLERVESVHGWPSDLFVIAFPDGTHAAVNADTRGMEPDPMRYDGLAVHGTKASAEAFVEAFPRMRGGRPRQTTYADAKSLAKAKGLAAILLYVGARAVDVEFLR